MGVGSLLMMVSIWDIAMVIYHAPPMPRGQDSRARAGRFRIVAEPPPLGGQIYGQSLPSIIAVWDDLGA